MTSLVDQLAHLPILLLITYRPDYLPPWNDRSHTRQMTLSRLSPEDSQRVVQAALPNSQNAVAIIQGIVSKAEGNPFFLEELSRSVKEQGHAVPLAVPDTAHAVLMARLDRLSPAARHLMQVAAVIGKEVPITWLAAMVNVSETDLEQTLTDLLNAEFLYEMQTGSDPIYTFTHILTQEAAYQSLLEQPRQTVSLADRRTAIDSLSRCGCGHP